MAGICLFQWNGIRRFHQKPLVLFYNIDCIHIMLYNDNIFTVNFRFTPAPQ